MCGPVAARPEVVSHANQHWGEYLNVEIAWAGVCVRRPSNHSPFLAGASFPPGLGRSWVFLTRK
jgi:hypothetical protein